MNTPWVLHEAAQQRTAFKLSPPSEPPRATTRLNSKASSTMRSNWRFTDEPQLVFQIHHTVGPSKSAGAASGNQVGLKYRALICPPAGRRRITDHAPAAAAN